MASFIYNACLHNTFRARFNFDSDAIKVMFVAAGYVPDKETHATRADVTDEAKGLGYNPGGIAVNVNVDMSEDTLVMKLGGATLPAATVTARYAVYFVSRGGDAEDDDLVACIDFGGDVSSTNAPFELTASTLRIAN